MYGGQVTKKSQYESVNEREKQTYYGAVDYVEGKLHTYCIR
jgi:hypothetical protein